MQKSAIPSHVMDERQALQRAAALCGARECCVSEIEEKLARWGVPPEGQERIVSRLLEEGFIDEARYSKAYARDKMRYNHWGRVKIDQALRLQGIASAHRAEALDELPEDEYTTILRHLIDAKLPSIKARSDFERKGKLFRFLLGRGFEMDAITRVYSMRIV